MNTSKVSMPNVTPAQIVSALIALLSVATVLFKLDISDADMAVIIGAVGTIVPAAWLIADAVLRRGRAAVVVARIENGLPENPPAPVAEQAAPPL